MKFQVFLIAMVVAMTAGAISVIQSLPAGLVTSPGTRLQSPIQGEGGAVSADAASATDAGSGTALGTFEFRPLEATASMAPPRAITARENAAPEIHGQIRTLCEHGQVSGPLTRVSTGTAVCSIVKAHGSSREREHQADDD